MADGSTIAEQIADIAASKAAIAAAIAAKGVEVPEGTKLAGLAEKVAAIQTGGGDAGLIALWETDRNTATEITIPDSVAEIGNGAFSKCLSLKSATIGNGVDRIPDDMFSYCAELESASLSSGVKSIESMAFYLCYKLQNINIPDTVQQIGNIAFCGCESLTNITIPKSVTSISEYAFMTHYLSEETRIINYEGNIADWLSIGFAYSALTADPGWMLYIDGKRLEGELVIPDGLISIGSNAFDSCKNFISVFIPDSVQIIGDYAFYRCESLTSVFIPDSVTSIGSNAFSYSNGLTIYCEAVSRPTGWNVDWNRGHAVVWDCRNNDVADDGFIYMVADGIRYGLKDNTAYVARQPETLSGEIVIHGSVEYKGNVYSVTSIGVDAFTGCSGLTSIVIPDSVTSIKSYAFTGCSGLTSIVIPDSVTSIGARAFLGCSGLNNVTFENPENWCVTVQENGGTAEVAISSDDLSDSVKAAELLGVTYCYANWKRAE